VAQRRDLAAPDERAALPTSHGPLPLPAFLPDGTRGVVRTVAPEDLRLVGIRGVMANSLHLAHQPGTRSIQQLGGLHSFMGWEGPIATDSGGFQVYSFLAGRTPMASVSDRGFAYRLPPQRRKRLLTPETAIENQLRLGSDIVFCLDYCTHPVASSDVQAESVKLTLAWAARSKLAFTAQLERRASGGPRPLLFAVVQGGESEELRRRCAEGLLEIGFDGFGFGGWPAGEEGRIVDGVAVVARLLPPGAPKHALGIGRPESIVAAWAEGYRLFDCTLPTRNARRGLAYQRKPGVPPSTDERFYSVIDLHHERWTRDARPLDEACDCPCCTRFPRAYLAHLFRLEEALGLRLATLHNLRFFSALLEELGP
jgi:queuine tRNA-ribosyltransferase